MTHAATLCFLFFFFNDTATTEIYTLSLHDALPISHRRHLDCWDRIRDCGQQSCELPAWQTRVRPANVVDRKSTRLNSSHSQISYAVFCLKKKKKQTHHHH